MKTNIQDYVGLKFGNLSVLSIDDRNTHCNANHWLFKCDCGKVISEYPSRVISGHKKSCGCRALASRYTHGYSKHEFYHTWWSMMQRCYNPKHHNFHRYGERGITVCNEWHDPKNFIEWAISTVGRKDTSLTLDRINNDLGYSPENCRWADMKMQSNNRRSNTLYTVDGKTHTFTEWCNEYVISDDVVWERINKHGWDVKKALETPINSFSEHHRYVTYNGETHNLTEWCRILGIPHSTVYQRLSRGISVLKALGLE